MLINDENWPFQEKQKRKEEDDKAQKEIDRLKKEIDQLKRQRPVGNGWV